MAQDRKQDPDDRLPIGADATFTMTPTWVLYADISAQAVRLYGVLRDIANRSGYGWASRRTLADRMHVKDEQTVDRALAELVAIEAVEVVPRWSEPEHGKQPHRLANGYLLRSVEAQGGGGTSTSRGSRMGAPTVGARAPEQNKTPSNKTNTSEAAQAKRGTRLPADWKPSPALHVYATDQGLIGHTLERVIEDFRDYWTAQPGQKGVKLDWDATWRRWVRTEVERRGIDPRAYQQQPRRLTHEEQMAEIRRREQEQMARIAEMDGATR